MSFLRPMVAWFKKENKSTFEQYLEAFIIIAPIAFLIRTWGYGLYQVPSGSMETTMLVGERFFADKFTVHFKDLKRGDIISFNDPTYKYSSNPMVNLWERYVWGPSNWTKRIIGLPGDHIEGKIEDGKPVVYVNGKKLDEPYLNKYPLMMIVRGNVMDYYSYDPSLPYDEQPFYRIDENAAKFSEWQFKRQGLDHLLRPGTPLPSWCTGKDTFDVHLKNDEYWAMGDNRLGSYDSRGWGPLKKSFIHGKIVYRIWSHDGRESWWIVDLIKHPIDFWKRFRWSRFFQVVR